MVATKIVCIIVWLMFFVGATALLPTMTTLAADLSNSEGINVIDSAGYHYLYSNKQVVDGVEGVIDVHSIDGKSVITRLSGLPPSGCRTNGFREPKKITPKIGGRAVEEEYIILCGNDEGHRQTLFIFRKGTLVTTLNYGDSAPNLIFNEKDGSYLSLIYERLQQEGGGIAPMLIVYRWNPFGFLGQFVPIFNSMSMEYYLSYYDRLKKEKIGTDALYTPMLAALISTSSVQAICSELDSAPLATFNKNEIDRALLFIQELDFPSFDTSVCDKRG